MAVLQDDGNVMLKSEKAKEIVNHIYPMLYVGSCNRKLAVPRRASDIRTSELNSKDEVEKMALHTAIHSMSLRRVIELLADDDANLNEVDADGNTPLIVAASLGRIEMIHVLVSNSSLGTLHSALLLRRVLVVRFPYAYTIRRCSVPPLFRVERAPHIGESALSHIAGSPREHEAVLEATGCAWS